MVKLGVLQEVRVRDVMTEGVVFLRMDATLAEAWEPIWRTLVTVRREARGASTTP
jgi:hypothetical protein